MSLHIWHFTAQYYPEQKGGLATHVSELAHGLAGAGHSVVVFVPGRQDISAMLQPNLRLERCAWGREKSPWKIDPVRAAVHRRVLSLGDRIRPTLIHCHDWHLYPIALDAAEHFRCPIAATFHVSQAVSGYWGAPLRQEIRATEQDMCNKSSLLITVSSSMQQELTRFYQLAPPRKIKVVLNGVDLPTLDKPLIHRTTERGTAALLIATVGRIAPQKGIPELLQSARKTLETYPQATYVLCGATDSAYERTLCTKWLDDQRISNAVRFTPMTNREEVYALYRSAALVVVPSRYEPFGYTALEAMMSGACVLASDHGGMPEFIEDRKTGVLIPAAKEQGSSRVDVDMLAELQCELLRHRGARKRIGDAAHHSSVHNHSRAVMVRETLALYADTI